MNDAVGWSAVILAALTMLKNIADALIARQTAKDKMQQDLKVGLLEEGQKARDIEIARIQKELLDCRGAHKESEEDRKQLRTESNQLRTEVEHLKVQLDMTLAEQARLLKNSDQSTGLVAKPKVQQPDPH